MPRGGKREGAGRKTQWVSGCTFSETTVIRVPITLKNKLLEIAHRLDAGEEIDLVTKSIIEENQYLKDEVITLKSQLPDSQQLELLPEIEGLLKKAKDLLYQESLVRSKDRHVAKKVFAALLNVDRDFFDRPRK
ncbi:MAG: hypothetical protein AB4372_18055 [Xenococcus sp. (in: cyanobacteria)]